MSTTLFPEPTWGEPADAIPDCSSFELAGPSPFRLTGAMIRLLQYHFSHPDNIQNPQLCDLIWTPAKGCSDEAVVNPVTNQPTDQVIPGSKIYIAAHYKRGGLSIQQRPAIFIKREAVSTKKVNAVTQNQAIPHLSRPGNNYEGDLHNVYILGKHSLMAVAQTGSSADAIAEEVYFRMLQYMTVIKNDFNLGAFFVESIGAVKQYPDEAKSSFYATVTVSWSYTYRWRLVKESPIIKRMSIIPVER